MSFIMCVLGVKFASENLCAVYLMPNARILTSINRRYNWLTGFDSSYNLHLRLSLFNALLSMSHGRHTSGSSRHVRDFLIILYN